MENTPRRLPGGQRGPSPARHYAGHTSQAAPPRNGASPEGAIDWRRWAHVFWRRKWWILAVTLLGTASAVYFARGEKPTYQARAMVWFETPERGNPMPMPIEIVNLFSAPGWADLLRSYAVLDGVVHELKLYLSPARDEDRPLFENFELGEHPRYGTYRLVVRLDNTYVLMDMEGNEVQTAEPGDILGAPIGFEWLPPPENLRPGREVVFSVRRPRAVADGIERKLEVQMDQGGNFIRLRFSGDDSEEAARVLNTILDHFVAMAAELKRQKLTKLAGTLEEQLTQSKQRLDRAERELQQYRVETITLPEDRRSRMVLPPPSTPRPGGDLSGGATGTAPQGASVLNSSDPVFDRFFTLQVERDRIEQDRRDLERILSDFQRTGELDAMMLETIPSVGTTSSLRAALEELGRKEVEHRSLLYRYTEQHAEVQRLAEQIRVLRQESIPSLVRGLIDRLGTREAQLAREIDTQTDELQDIPPRAIREAQLQREVFLAEQIHNTLQSEYKKAQVAEAATQPNVRVLDRAVPPPSPTGSTARLKILVGFVLSLGLAVGSVVAYEQYLNRRLQYPEQVVADLGLPILGVVPNLKKLQAQAPTEDAASPQALGAIESFRALRTQLTHGLKIQYPAVIAITSPSMGDGKSLVTTNLALAFADPHRRTVLIDGDVRRGSLHRIFGTPRSPGLADYLRGDAEAAMVINQTSTNGLYFVPRGPYSEEIPELLDGEGLPTLLARLKQNADVVLIDTPPLAAGVDAVLIGAHADAVLAVLRTGRTDLDLARAKLASYAQMLGVPMVGAVLNDVQAEGPYYRYYTYSYEVYPYEAT